MKARIVNLDNSTSIIDLTVKKLKNKTIVSISKDAIDNNVNYVDFAFDYFNASVGDEGYFVTDMQNNGTFLTKFLPRDEQKECVCACCFTACYGWKKKQGGILGIITGMRCDFVTVLGLKGEEYYALILL